MEDIHWSFGELESALAQIHAIDQTKRTAFQSRLKNFHRLGYPVGFKGIKGKAASYSPLQIVEMALAVEMTQLGLPPERSTVVLTRNRWQILMATELVARELRADPTVWDRAEGLSEAALAMFLYFDPAALQPLTNPLIDQGKPSGDKAVSSFFYVGTGTADQGISGWTNSKSARLSVINLTVMIASIAAHPEETDDAAELDNRRAFYSLLEQSASVERAAV